MPQNPPALALVTPLCPAASTSNLLCKQRASSLLPSPPPWVMCDLPEPRSRGVAPWALTLGPVQCWGPHRPRLCPQSLAPPHPFCPHGREGSRVSIFPHPFLSVPCPGLAGRCSQDALLSRTPAPRLAESHPFPIPAPRRPCPFSHPPQSHSHLAGLLRSRVLFYLLQEACPTSSILFLSESLKLGFPVVLIQPFV